MIAPGRALFLASIVPAFATLALYLDLSAWPLVVGIDVVLLAIALIDLTSLPRKKHISARREMGQVATRGEWHDVTLVIENRSRRVIDTIVRDDQMPELNSNEHAFPVRLPPKSRARLQYRLIPRRRGAFRLEHVYLQSSSKLKLWTKLHRLNVRDELRVYPALKQISRYALYARLNRMSLLGVRRIRRVGTDNEFERLRDYTPDDQYRSIDWRATSRRFKLTIRDYQSNQSQRVVFLIDCGRMMVNESGGHSLLDAAFDAALTLGYVTLTQKDEAGLMCFSDRVLRWLPPVGGRQQLNRMVHAVHDVHPELVESRFDLAMLHLQQQCRKRTLVIVITNLIDEQNADVLRAHVANLVGRHLPLTVLLRDHELFTPIERLPRLDAESSKIPATLPQVYTAAAAGSILNWRHQVLTDLRHSGALTIDTTPENLTAPLINEYMRIKAMHLL